MKQILIVDDSDITRRFYAYVLDRAGYRVVSTEDGVLALERLYQGAFDLLVTDINMPRMDGFTLIREVRAIPEFARLPIVIVSSEDGLSDRVEAMGLGADVYLTKPSDPDHLIACVQDILEAAS